MEVIITIHGPTRPSSGPPGGDNLVHQDQRWEVWRVNTGNTCSIREVTIWFVKVTSKDLDNQDQTDCSIRKRCTGNPRSPSMLLCSRGVFEWKFSQPSNRLECHHFLQEVKFGSSGSVLGGLESQDQRDLTDCSVRRDAPARNSHA
ncbi:hypothetical protein J6590_016559 [Homalodisca vitripennis]|nr:hypothetical protein J6590_016559 [Homalodisca vitripennis]